MYYLLFICSDGVPTPEKTAAMRRETPRWVDEMQARGVRRMGHALREAPSAHTVRVRDGETLVSDGPFAESKEFIGGFDVIECADLDEAIEVAAKHPVAWFHCVEVRPFAEPPMGGSRTARPEDETASPARTGALAPVAEGRQRYLLLICASDIAKSDAAEAEIRRDGGEWLARARRQGSHVYGHALTGAETASTVRVREGETVISDGPFIETTEFVAGFDIVDCADEDEAIALAAEHPLARHHMIEVRPFADQQ